MKSSFRKPKITCGIDNVKEIELLVSAGADEFFCGVLDEKIFNARPNNARFNLKNLKELSEAIKKSHSFGKQIFLTLNTPFLTSQSKQVIEFFRETVNLGIDGAMIANLPLLSEISRYKKLKVKIAASTMLPLFNSESINFLKQFKVARVVLERLMTLQEVLAIDRKIKGVELEIIATKVCRYNNSSCHFWGDITGLSHAYAPGAKVETPCRFPLNLSVTPSQGKLADSRIRSFFEQKFWDKEEKNELILKSLDELFSLRKLKNNLVFKLPTRGYPTSYKVWIVEVFVKAINFLHENRPNRKTYLEFCKNYVKPRERNLYQ